MAEILEGQRGLFRFSLMEALRAGRLDLSIAGLSSLVAAVTAAVASMFSSFENSVWLVAYLTLVGFLAQVLLGAGQAALLAGNTSSLSRGVRWAQTGLWNLGVVTVPAGVLSDTKLLVVIGSLSLIAGLASFRMSVQPALAPARNTWLCRGYVVLLAGLIASVFVGTALAWDLPWV